ncbi:LytTR family DNA-binding domain-containing protein [Asticcacaulis sp. AC402]|uniref:LytR/AlgR family response regulator transcription factor n=1 Tax=Asticcacaulis sp. AC402 TaxID=1282361 RepID=UPI0003C3F61F|nr:LytTR family DNA-binding domain-containing protein [Asticcacaulis sp. AC402]ESQ74995.1 hypothetical protein ABAC402_11365 [Asticcacaulis sp. AC402]
MNGWMPWRLYLAVMVLVWMHTIVNVSSELIENPPGDREFHIWEPFTWEISSALTIMIVLPVIWLGYRQFHWRRLGLTLFCVVHAVGLVMFSLSHVAIMVVMRKAVYATMGSAYDFTHGNLLLHLIYEGRKDGLAYLLFLAFFWAYERVTEAKPLPQGDGRIEVKTDGRTLYLAADEIIYAEAAGNYVELHLATKPLLIRGTLSALEKRLTGFARIHRSRLLNPVHMKSYTATPSGDLRITLSDGREIVASRRYRSALLDKETQS